MRFHTPHETASCFGTAQEAYPRFSFWQKYKVKSPYRALTLIFKQIRKLL